MTDSGGGVGVLRKVLGEPSVRPDRTLNGREEFGRYLDEVLDRFRLITTVDELWNAGVGRGLFAYDVHDEREIGAYYREWLAEAEEVDRELQARHAVGLVLPNEPDFATCLEDARGICTPDEDFFAGPGLEAVRDQAVESYHAGETGELRDIGD